jgi:dUTP pyrophosphatase
MKFKKFFEHAILPEYGTDDAAGIDLFACEKKLIQPGGTAVVDTGIGVAIPKGFVGDIRPRSGLAAKHGVTVLNAPGTIDSDYRGKIKVILINHGGGEYMVNRGDRIAQMLVNPVKRIDVELVDDLDETKRGSGGLGSTGK